jgi:hypothetical protein
VRAWTLGARGACERAADALAQAIESHPDWPLRARAADAVSGCR